MPQATAAQIDIIVATFTNMKSRRAKILTALHGILELVKKSNGYNHTLQNVSFDVRGWDTVVEAETPIVFIVDDKTSSIKRHAGRQREYIWQIRLFGIVKERTLVEFEEIITDIEECIENNYTLAGTVSKVEINQVVTDNQLFSEKDGTHLFEIEIAAEYIRCHGSPE